MKRKITFDDFFIGTFATFKGCKVPKREPDYISKSRYDGEISSMYWYGEDSRGQYVIRASDHWVMMYEFKKNKKQHDCNLIASCLWNLKTNYKDSIKVSYKTFHAGKCYLKDFKDFRG